MTYIKIKHLWREQIGKLEKSLDDLTDNKILRNQYTAEIESLKRGYYVLFRESYKREKEK